MTGGSRSWLETSRGAFSALFWEAAPGSPSRLPLVFSHATGFNAQTYAPLLGPLAGERPLVAVDARGHGLTDLPADPGALSDWEPYVDDLQAVVAALGGRAHLAGHSLGAVVGLRLAARWPAGVASVTLLEPVMPSPLVCALLRGAVAVGLRERLPLVEQARRRRARFESREAMVRAYTGRGAFTTWPAPWIEAYVAGGAVDDAEGGVALACAPAWEAATFAATPYDSWAALAALQVPVAILYGGRSTTFSRRSERAALRRQPGALVERIDRATHFLPMERPDEARGQMKIQWTRGGDSPGQPPPSGG